MGSSRASWGRSGSSALVVVLHHCGNSERGNGILEVSLLLYHLEICWTVCFIPFCLSDFAKPPVNETREPEQFLMQAPPGNPLLLPHTLQELLSKDSVQVELIPEKKGLFLKHVEYEVSSKVT